MNMKYIDDQKDLEDYNTVDINIEAEEKEQDENTDNYPNLSIKIEQAQYFWISENDLNGDKKNDFN